jgi:hypothetical protein
MQSGESAGHLLEISSLLAVGMARSACGRKVSERVGSVLVISLVRRDTGYNELEMHVYWELSCAIYFLCTCTLQPLFSSPGRRDPK